MICGVMEYLLDGPPQNPHSPLSLVLAFELRVTLLILALQAMGAAWLVEQPISSLAFYHPRLRSILRSIDKVWLFHVWVDEV